MRKSVLISLLTEGLLMGVNPVKKALYFIGLRARSELVTEQVDKSLQQPKARNIKGVYVLDKTGKATCLKKV